MDWKYLYTSFEGRINRQPYWIGGLVLIPVLIVLNLIFFALGIPRGVMIFGLIFNQLITALLLIYPLLALMVKRFHDRDKSGWWALVFYIPSIINGVISASQPGSSLAMITGLITLVVAVWFIIELGFLKGTDGQNDYGPDPLES